MDIPPVTEQGREYVRTHRPEENENGRKLPHRLVATLQVTPHVPLYITYYTLFPDMSGQLRTYPDVYGYDQTIWTYLKKYI
jgi:murein L,D-transpeptidase YcbB/YkuD